uniref:Transposase Tnp1/En/Spm-like domain-containing protein n=1 Tax=Leersia perrieri TaxID=77586 RepID=A0A0D9WL73_9ORYZ
MEMDRDEICFYNLIDLIEQYGYSAVDYLYYKQKDSLVVIEQDPEVMKMLNECESKKMGSLFVTKERLATLVPTKSNKVPSKSKPKKTKGSGGTKKKKALNLMHTEALYANEVEQLNDENQNTSGDGDEVGSTVLLMTSKYPNKANVAYATLLSTDPEVIVGGVKIGSQFYKVRIEHPITKDEPLVRPMSRYNNIGDAHARGVSIAWPVMFTLAEDKADSPLHKDPRIKRLCLSFALHKLLLRRFENFYFTDEEVKSCRVLIFKGLYTKTRSQTETDKLVEVLFQVLNDELHFICEYYHSVLPVVLSSPFFLIANYFLFSILVLPFFVLTLILCNNADLFYAFKSVKIENIIISFSLFDTFDCLLKYITTSASTLLHRGHFHHHASNDPMGSEHDEPTHASVQIVVHARRLPPILPKSYDASIQEYLVNHIDHGAPLSNGWSMLQKKSEYHSLSWVCLSDSITEVMHIWYIATSILEVDFPKKNGMTGTNFQSNDDRIVVTTLSKYCAYLVIFKQELLPDNLDGTTQLVYDAMKEEMKVALKLWHYYFLREMMCTAVDTCVDKVKKIDEK